MLVELVEALDNVVKNKEHHWEDKDPPRHARDVVILPDLAGQLKPEALLWPCSCFLRMFQILEKNNLVTIDQ